LPAGLEQERLADRCLGDTIGGRPKDLLHHLPAGKNDG
jgi:hypothetical protein